MKHNAKATSTAVVSAVCAWFGLHPSTAIVLLAIADEGPVSADDIARLTGTTRYSVVQFHVHRIRGALSDGSFEATPMRAARSAFILAPQLYSLTAKGRDELRRAFAKAIEELSERVPSLRERAA